MKPSSPALPRPDKKPSHIIAFKHPEKLKDNEDLFDRLLKPKCGGSRSEEGSCVRYEPASPTTAASRFYRGLAAAVADLDGEQEKQFLGDALKDLVSVFPNQTRQMPRPVHEPREPVTVVGAAAGGAAVPGGFAPHWHVQRIGADVNPFTGAGVKVAVLDSGIDTDHPDFRGRNFGANNSIFYVENTIEDMNGHGTHCAGLIIGDPDRAIASPYGISPKADLLVAKVLDQSRRGDDDHVLAGLEWAERMGAQIISMSFGWVPSANDPLAELIERVAKRLLNATPGALVIAAAGNESRRPGQTAPVWNPAAYPSIMAVAAVDRNDQVAAFSCGQLVAGDGREINFAAPGVNIYSAWEGGRRYVCSGTSSATPIVAGVAARILHQHDTQNPGVRMRALDLRARLEQQATRLAPPTDFGVGLVHL